MRVIAGSAKGIKLISPKGYETRPTTDRAKEALFSIFFDKINNCVFLDLFSGSGSIGIEALSRGAKESIFVDRASEAVELINKNIKKTNFTDKATVYAKDVVSFLNTTNKKFDIIFIDPPYDFTNSKLVLNEILKNDVLDADGLIVLEQDKRSEILKIEGLEISDTRKYGKSNLIFYKKGE